MTMKNAPIIERVRDSAAEKCRRERFWLAVIAVVAFSAAALLSWWFVRHEESRDVEERPAKVWVCP